MMNPLSGGNGGWGSGSEGATDRGYRSNGQEMSLLEDWLKKKFVWRNVAGRYSAGDRLSDINWQVRYFRLYPDRLEYYANSVDSRCLGEIAVEQLVVRANDDNTFSIYPQKGAVRLHPDMEETLVERCYLRRCTDSKIVREGRGSIYSLQTWIHALRQMAYPKYGCDLVIHMDTNKTILWGEEGTQHISTEDVAYSEAWKDDEEFIQFAFDHFGEGHDITTFSNWLRQARNVSSLVEYAQQFVQGSPQRMERMRRILRDVSEDKSVPSFWRLLEWIRDGDHGIRVLVVFRTFNTASIPELLDRCAAHGFAKEVVMAEDQRCPLVWSILHEVDEQWSMIGGDDCKNGFQQPNYRGHESFTALQLKYEEAARKQWDQKKYFRPFVYTQSPAITYHHRWGHKVVGFHQFDEIDPSKTLPIENMPAAFRGIHFPEDSFLRIMAIQENYHTYSNVNWRNGKPVCAGPFVRPHQVVFDHKVFSKIEEDAGTSIIALYDLFGNFIDGSRESLMHRYSAELTLTDEELEMIEGTEIINVPLFYQTLLHAKMNHDTATGDPMYFIGRIVDLIPLLQADIPVNKRKSIKLSIPPIRHIKEVEGNWALPIVWDPRRISLTGKVDTTGVFIKCVQWNILADSLAAGKLQLYDHRRPYNAQLFEEARDCLDRKQKWMPLSIQAQLYNARYSKDDSINQPKYWKLREPINLIVPVVTEQMMDANEEMRDRFEMCVLGWEHRCSIIIDNLLEQRAHIIFLEEVDRFSDFKAALIKSELNDIEYQGFHISSNNSRTKFVCIRNALQKLLIHNLEDTLQSVIANSIARCTLIQPQTQKEMLMRLNKNRMRQEAVVEMVFKDYSDELTKIDIWDDICSALWEIPPAKGQKAGRKPKFLEDGVAIFIDTDVFVVDETALDQLKYHLLEREVYDDDGCKYYKNCEVYERSVEPGHLYLDPKQKCVYFYYESCKSSGAVVIPVIRKDNRNCHAILFCTHLRSGSNDAAERTRQNQVTELAVQLESFRILMDRHGPMIGGIDANTDPKFRLCREWAWNANSNQYVEQSSGITASVNTYELLNQYGFETPLPETGVTVMREYNVFALETAGGGQSRGKPTLQLTDYVCIKNDRDNPDCKNEIVSHSVSINTTIQHMLPNVIEPSDHKGVVSWLEMRPSLTKKRETVKSETQSNDNKN